MTCACARASKKHILGVLDAYDHTGILCAKGMPFTIFPTPPNLQFLFHLFMSRRVETWLVATKNCQNFELYFIIFPHWDNYSFQKNNHCYAAFEPIKLRVWALLSEHSPITKPKDASPSGAFSERAGLWGPAPQLTTTHGFHGTNFCEFYALFKAVAVCWVGGRVQHVTPLVQKFSSWRINDTFRDASVRSRWRIDTSAKRDVRGLRSL